MNFFNNKIRKGDYMEIKNIKTFLKVAVTQNFSKAAQQLGYSQSAVTIQIQQLEKELGIPLFERLGKKVYLTEQGEAFISYANNIVKAADTALIFCSSEKTPSGSLRIGGAESICTALLPQLLPAFHDMYPNIKITIRSGTTEELMALAKSNEIDCILTLDHRIYRNEWICAAKRTEDIIFVTLKDPAAPSQSFLEIEKLAARPFILTEVGAAYHYELEKLLSERELHISPVLEIGNTETIIHLLKKGMGYSFLPRFTVKEELQRSTLTEVGTNLPPVKMFNQLFYHKNKYVTPQMQLFIQLVIHQFQSC